jgi:hypothetical protein
MDGITQAQQADRWMEGTPVHLLYMDAIKAAVPGALFVHLIRDGRDCALSNAAQGWLATLPWDKTRGLGVAALYWEWMVRRGRRFGRANPDVYLELRFEDLVADPRATLARLAAFIDHDLDYDRIQQHANSLKNPNTSFRKQRNQGDFNPVGRWNQCPPDDIRLCEMLVGRYLRELGYPLADPANADHPDARARMMRALYMPGFATKHWLKTRTPLGRYMTRTKAWAEQPRVGERLPMPTTIKYPAMGA